MMDQNIFTFGVNGNFEAVIEIFFPYFNYWTDITNIVLYENVVNYSANKCLWTKPIAILSENKKIIIFDCLINLYSFTYNFEYDSKISNGINIKLSKVDLFYNSQISLSNNDDFVLINHKQIKSNEKEYTCNELVAFNLNTKKTYKVYTSNGKIYEIFDEKTLQIIKTSFNSISDYFSIKNTCLLFSYQEESYRSYKDDFICLKDLSKSSEDNDIYSSNLDNFKTDGLYYVDDNILKVYSSYFLKWNEESSSCYKIKLFLIN